MNHLFLTLIFLGIVQGIAEFLPVSSSGHLVIFENIECFKSVFSSGGNGMMLFVNVALHVATLIAVIIYLRKDLAFLITGFFTSVARRDYSSPAMKSVINILAASVPAGIIGILLNDIFEKLFSSLLPVFIFLIINGFILITTKKIPLKNRKIEEMGIIRSVVIGFFQALAIMPGISRSGMTIAGGLFNGLEPNDSARFSFLMAIPVIAGAGLIEGIKAAGGGFPSELYLPMLSAMVITIGVALVSMKILFAMVKQVRIDVFGYYTILVGIAGTIFLLAVKCLLTGPDHRRCMEAQLVQG